MKIGATKNKNSNSKIKNIIKRAAITKIINIRDIKEITDLLMVTIIRKGKISIITNPKI
jgi:hypothetical protein